MYLCSWSFPKPFVTERLRDLCISLYVASEGDDQRRPAGATEVQYIHHFWSLLEHKFCVAVPTACRAFLSALSICLDPGHFAKTMCTLKAPDRTEVGDYCPESAGPDK